MDGHAMSWKSDPFRSILEPETAKWWERRVSGFWILETMPVGFSEGQEKTVNQPVQLWECSCEIAEGNDEVESKLIKWTHQQAELIKWTHQQAESNISMLEDKNQYLEWLWQVRDLGLREKKEKISTRTITNWYEESVGPTQGCRQKLSSNVLNKVDHTLIESLCYMEIILSN